MNKWYIICLLGVVGCASNNSALRQINRLEQLEQEDRAQDLEVKRLEQEADALAASIKNSVPQTSAMNATMEAAQVVSSSVVNNISKRVISQEEINQEKSKIDEMCQSFIDYGGECF